ncbi:hypothetical protein FACS1894120_3960 [Clostridia bacterium]|nr:hypothetical protein FACS1894120_3960 [Clostridia bacterium]
MTYSVHTFEIRCEVPKKYTAEAYKRSKGKYRVYEKPDDVHNIDAFVKQGIRATVRKKKCKHYLEMIINPTVLLGGEDYNKLWKPTEENIATVLDELKKAVAKLGCKLKDFELTRLDYCVNADVGSHKKVKAYISTLQNLGKVKGYEPKFKKSDTKIDKKRSFDLTGNSNGIDFTVYDKEKQLESENISSSKAEGILRIEVKLTKAKAIKKYTSEKGVSDRLYDLCADCEDNFRRVFEKIVPDGDFYRLSEAKDIISKSGLKKKRQQKMTALLETIPKKKSLQLAQKKLGYRDIGSVMEWFNAQGLSPICVSKRCEYKQLLSLYYYL